MNIPTYGNKFKLIQKSNGTYEFTLNGNRIENVSDIEIINISLKEIPKVKLTYSQFIEIDEIDLVNCEVTEDNKQYL